MKKISICMAVFNGENYIEAQISSILVQMSPVDELIISDDHSIDNTIAIVKGFKDERIIVICNKFSRGYAGNFENAISHASGDIIFLSDQDDIWMEGKVRKMLDVLDSFHLVVSNAEYVDKNLNSMNETLFFLRDTKRGFLNNIYKSRYLGACMAFRREILGKLLPFPRNRGLCPHDLWITLIAECYFKVAILPEPLILYRRHDGNTSDGGNKSRNDVLRMIIFRTYSLLMVMSRMFK